MRQKHSEREAESNLFRCMSDASLVKRRRGRGKSAAQTEKEKQHRFSINGHYYNYKVSFRLLLLLSPFENLCQAQPFFTKTLICFSSSSSLLSFSSSISHWFLQTSIFTPSFGTPTKVRISSRMTTNQVIEQLLSKFKVGSYSQDCWKSDRDVCKGTDRNHMN